MSDRIHQILQTISVERIRQHIQMIEGVRHPVVAPEALERAADYIKQTFETLGYETSEHHFAEDERDYRNILGLRRGTRYPEKRLLVMAHYDTERNTPGANDNASGVAALLELARICQPLIFEISVQFVGVNLEESKWGVRPQAATVDNPEMAIARGSQALAAYAKINNWDIQGVINFEEIAFAGDTVVQKAPAGWPIALPQVGDFIAVVGNERSAALVRGFGVSIERYQIPLPYVPLVVPGYGHTLPDTRRSDHAPFWDQGYPAIMVTDTANFRTPHYHKASDILDTLNLTFAADVCRAVAGLVIDIAGVVTSQ